MKRILIFGLLISIFLVLVISHFVSEFPDGLEKIAFDKSFSHKIEEKFKAPIPDYELQSISNKKISTSLAGLIGVFLTFIAIYGLGYFFKSK